jgi:hypothetical protein
VRCWYLRCVCVRRSTLRGLLFELGKWSNLVYPIDFYMFISLFADLGDYDDRTTPGGAQLDKLGHWPYSTTPVLDTG